MTDDKVLIKIKGKRQSQLKDKAAKIKRTAYFYTLNTNCRYKDDDAHFNDDEAILEDVVLDILRNADQYIEITEEGRKWDRDTILDVDTEYTIEKGSKAGQLHCHILFRIKHTTKVKLNYAKIKQRVLDRLGLENVYTFNRLLGNGAWSEDFMRDYINKAR